MLRPPSVALALSVLVAVALPAQAQTTAAQPGLERLIVLDCGSAHAPDQSRWSPGVNVGKPIDISDNCYLIRHRQGLMLWDTGVPDALAAATSPASGGIPWTRSKTLVGQLAAIGVAPDDIRFIGISHTHGDHVGNVDLFPKATVLIQKAEYDWAFGLANKPFRADHPVELLSGDRDVFGDGSVTILSTPGHTPGHESLLVQLPKTGAILLSGDAAHFKDNWDNRRIPATNASQEQSLASMQKIADVLANQKAALWINHDAAQTMTLRHAPEFYE